VGGTALALPMDAIQEIIRVPALQHSPLADDVCTGMLNLRGATVPVLDFGKLLDFARANGEEVRADERRIVVLHRNDLHFGLLVDEVASIVAYRDEELLPMPTYGGSAQRSLFAGYLPAEHSAGVLLINADTLFGNERIVALATGHRDLYRNVLAQASEKRGARTRQTLVTFRIGQLIGVRIAELREVIDYRDDIVRTPGLPTFVRGMLNLRGVLVTVIDVRAMYSMPPYEDLSRAKVLIVEHAREKYGLLVDSVEDIVTLNGVSQLAVPSVFGRSEGLNVRNDMREAVELPGQGTLMLLDPTSLCVRVAEAAAA
jgi:purine-binding chemotaxis protein CheW